VNSARPAPELRVSRRSAVPRRWRRRYHRPITLASTTAPFGAGPSAPPLDGASASGAGGPESPTAASSAPPGAQRPVSRLRGAAVEVDARRAGRVAVVCCLVALAATAAVLFVAGARKNAQMTDLRAHGIPVEVTVTGCIGLMGGSGSNVAGFSCQGTFTFDGRRYTASVPDAGFHAQGSTMRAVTLADDPGLLATPGAGANGQASWRVFVVPTVLVLVLALLLGAIVVRRRRVRRAPVGPPAPSREPAGRALTSSDAE
jgi:hypothetical protein